MAIPGLTAIEEAKLDKAVENYLRTIEKAAERAAGRSFVYGKDFVDANIGIHTAFMSEVNKLAVDGVTLQNVQLTALNMQSYFGTLQKEIQHYINIGRNANDLKSKIDKAAITYKNHQFLIANDQMAKAQKLGRDAEYKNLGVEFVEVMVHPDACQVCFTSAPQQPVPLGSGERPQYHIQCLCYDIPAAPPTGTTGAIEPDSQGIPKTVEELYQKGMKTPFDDKLQLDIKHVVNDGDSRYWGQYRPQSQTIGIQNAKEQQMRNFFDSKGFKNWGQLTDAERRVQLEKSKQAFETYFHELTHANWDKSVMPFGDLSKCSDFYASMVDKFMHEGFTESYAYKHIDDWLRAMGIDKVNPDILNVSIPNVCYTEQTFVMDRLIQSYATMTGSSFDDILYQLNFFCPPELPGTNLHMADFVSNFLVQNSELAAIGSDAEVSIATISIRSELLGLSATGNIGNPSTNANARIVDHIIEYLKARIAEAKRYSTKMLMALRKKVIEYMTKQEDIVFGRLVYQARKVVFDCFPNEYGKLDKEKIVKASEEFDALYDEVQKTGTELDKGEMASIAEVLAGFQSGVGLGK